jgi:hypothetical protein
MQNQRMTGRMIAAKTIVTMKMRLRSFSANWRRSSVSGRKRESKRFEQAFPRHVA